MSSCSTNLLLTCIINDSSFWSFLKNLSSCLISRSSLHKLNSMNKSLRLFPFICYSKAIHHTIHTVFRKARVFMPGLWITASSGRHYLLLCNEHDFFFLNPLHNNPVYVNGTAFQTLKNYQFLLILYYIVALNLDVLQNGVFRSHCCGPDHSPNEK